ncbi:hypothetical protein CTZ27_12055 [Streptomyces griseocarneus]|nr:hypothetical protein CTZ27_12055 [Streptomyces griseocarneus]
MTADVWGMGYRTGVLVADKETGALGLTVSKEGRTFTVRGLGGGDLWKVDLSRLRLANDEERAGLGIAPRSVSR